MNSMNITHLDHRMDSLPASSAYELCKQFESRPGPTNLIQTIGHRLLFLEEFTEKVNL